jgi:DegV family protein with EDD domain
MERKKIAITTDTNSGMVPGDMDDKGVFVLPMPFTLNGQDYLEIVDISHETFWEQFNEHSTVSTSQPSIGNLTDFWTEILNNYDEIVHIPTSSSLSNSFFTAQNLAKEFNGKVKVVDSKRISIILHELVVNAANFRDQGKTSAEIVAFVEETREEYSLYFSLKTLEYLKRGGRVSPAAAAIGSILKIKPILKMRDGKLEKSTAVPERKATETMKKSIANDLMTKFKEFADKGEIAISCAYTNNPDEARAHMEDLKAFLQNDFPNIEYHFEDPISISVACHTGPGAYGFSCSKIVK